MVVGTKVVLTYSRVNFYDTMLVGSFRETAIFELISYHDGSVLTFIVVWESTPGCVIAGVISLHFTSKKSCLNNA